MVWGKAIELIDDDGELRRKAVAELAEARAEEVLGCVGNEIVCDGPPENYRGGE